jgi:hypothetical protein
MGFLAFTGAKCRGFTRFAATISIMYDCLRRKIMHRELNSLILFISFLIFFSCIQKKDTEKSERIDEKQIYEYRERIKTLKARAHRIQDSNDIKRLQRIFGYYFDRGLWEEMADLFAENATLEL